MILKIRGKRKLEGTIKISGAKNSAVAIIPAATLCDEAVTLRNIPNIEDVKTLIEILKEQGYSIFFENNTLRISKTSSISPIYKSDLVSSLRGSTYLMGSTIANFKKTKIKYFGGCALGNRPIDYHLEGFKMLNIKVKSTSDYIILKRRKIIPNSITLDFASVGATINLILASTKAKGKTIINNAAQEPEVVDVCMFLKSMGAIIQGEGTNTITITGVKHLYKTDYTIISDRIEAGTFLILGALSNANGITVKNINPLHLTSLIEVLKDIGLSIDIKENCVSIKKEKALIPCHIRTAVFPGFPTDLGPLISILFTQIEGTSIIDEAIFSNRFSHVSELKKMNAFMRIDKNSLIVEGITQLKPARITAKDLRGAASLVLAATLTKGYTYIENIDCLFRGYENIIEKLTSLGLSVEIIK